MSDRCRPAVLSSALLAAISELVGRAGSYASLRFAVDTADPAIGALLQHVQERATAIEKGIGTDDLSQFTPKT